MKRRGVTLLELLITAVLAGIILTAAINYLWAKIPEYNLKEDTRSVEQFLEKAKNTAIKKSSIVIVDFDQASTSHGDLGGKILIKFDGSVVDTLDLSKNVLLNSGSTIGEEVRFNYRGEPVDTTNSIDGFTSSNNKIILSYYKSSSPAVSRSIQIVPGSGKIELLN